MAAVRIPQLSAKHAELFRELRIPEELVTAAKVETVTDEQAREYGVGSAKTTGDLSGIFFPYFVPGVNWRVSCRLRRDHPEMEDGKPKNKYIASWGDVRHLYFPPGSAERLADPRTPIVFVEAEKSSLAITAWSQRTGSPLLGVATGGCWGWRGRIGKTVDASGARVDEEGPLPDLQYAEGRTVYILFDANAAENKDVQKARRAFAKALKKFRATDVVVLDLPGGPWNGPDDYLGLNSDDLFAELFEKQSAETDDRPVVVINAGEVPKATDQAEDILLDHAVDLKLFQRSGQVVRIITLPEAQKEGALFVPSGAVIIESVSRCVLQETLERLIHFQKVDKEGEPHTIDCPGKLAESYLGRTGSRRLPILTGIVSAPLMLADGTVLEKPGYDAATGLYFASNVDWLEIPKEPKLEDAREALATLLVPFSQFPFCAEADRATHVAGILTAIQRRMLRTAPMIAYKAPERRTGKSLLAESLAIISTGRPAPATATSGEEEEFRKAIMAALYRGHSIINLDNLERPLSSPSLCMALTQEIYEDRVLGESRMLQLPTRVLWTCTGNNLTLKGDLTVRALMCSIDAQSEHPEERAFHIPDLRGFLLDYRREMVKSALTILRAYHVAGSPKQNVKPWGGFDEWSRIIREALVWVGLPDPAQTREEIATNDPERENASALLHALRDGFQEEPFTLKQAIGLSAEGTHSNLREALANVAGRKGEIDSRVLGWWCRKNRDRVVAGLQLSAAGQTDRYTRWRVLAKGLFHG